MSLISILHNIIISLITILHNIIINIIYITLKIIIISLEYIINSKYMIIIGNLINIIITRNIKYKINNKIKDYTSMIEEDRIIINNKINNYNYNDGNGSRDDCREIDSDDNDSNIDDNTNNNNNNSITIITNNNIDTNLTDPKHNNTNTNTKHNTNTNNNNNTNITINIIIKYIIFRIIDIYNNIYYFIFINNFLFFILLLEIINILFILYISNKNIKIAFICDGNRRYNNKSVICDKDGIGDSKCVISDRDSKEDNRDSKCFINDNKENNYNTTITNPTTITNKITTNIKTTTSTITNNNTNNNTTKIEGIKTIIMLSKLCKSIGIKEISFFVLATKNYCRVSNELNMIYNNIFYNKIFNIMGRIKFYGIFNKKIEKKFKDLEMRNLEDGFLVNFMFGYSSKYEIENNIKSVDIPDIIIRTGGEKRLSDFMLYSAAKGSFIEFVDILWPELSNLHMVMIICKMMVEKLLLRIL